MANQNVIQDIKFEPSKVMNPAGKLVLDDFKKEFPQEVQILRKVIPEAALEAKLNEVITQLRNVKWGFSVQEYGGKGLLLAVQTPNLGLVKNGQKAQSYSFKIYKKAVKLQLLKAEERTALIKKASVLDLTIRTEKVPAGFTLFKSVTNSTASLHLFGDSNVEEGVIYVYRLYTSTTSYIEVTHRFQAVVPTITSFTATPDPLERKVKFSIDVKNATKIEIYKGTATQPLANTTQDTAVVNGSTYSYTLKVSNAWGKTASKTVTARCVNMLPSKPVLSVAKDAAYIRTRLSWTVFSNVASCKIARAKKVGTSSTTTTLSPTYKNGYCYDSGVVKGGVYAYTMTATNGWGSTTGSSVMVTMTGSAPAVPTITGLSTNSSAKVTVNYTSSANATSYRIYRTVNNQETLAGTSSTISYYDSTVPINEDVTYKVSAVNAWGESAKSAAKQIFSYRSPNNQIKRRALCIATKFNTRSIYSCKEMKKAFEHNGIPSKYVENLSKTALANELKTYFADMDADDYPIIMCNAHGSYDYIWLCVENGSDASVSYADFKKMLDKVPGHKIVLIDACFSGSAIATRSNATVSSTFSMTDFAATIRTVFAKKAVATTAKKAAVSTRSAELATSDYSVICSATPNQSSWGVGDEYNHIPHWWSKGLGWDFLAVCEACKPCKHYADTNGNKSITVAELTEYSRVQEVNRTSNPSYRSEPFCWPANDSKVIATYSSDNITGIRYFKLKNSGIFRVRLEVKYTDPSTGKSVTWKSGLYNKGTTKTVDLASFIPRAGVRVKLNAFVQAGKDKSSGEFYYHPDSTQTASFTISGTTLSNKLKQN